MTDLGLGLFLRNAKPAGEAAPAPPAVADPPSDIALSAATLNENATQGTAIGTLSATGGEGALVFSLVSSFGNRVQISGTALQAGSAPVDYESDATFQITVRVTDALSRTYDEDFTITVTDVFEAATLDDHGPSVTLSGGGLVATVGATTGNLGARSFAFRNSGKYYFEFTATDVGGTNLCVGVLTDGGNYVNAVTNGTNGAFVYSSTGAVYGNDADSLKDIGAVGAGAVVCAAIDFDNDKVWFRLGAAGNWNGEVIGSQDPANNVGGVSISNYATKRLAPVVGFGTTAQAGDAITCNFGASAFTGAVPTGFTSGWPQRTNQEWIVAFETTFSADSGGWNGYTLRNRMNAAVFGAFGNTMRITVKAGDAEGATIDACYVGNAKAASDVFDFLGDQVQVTFGGATSLSLVAGESRTSDEINYALGRVNALMPSFHFNSTADTIRGVANTNVTHYFKAAVSEAGTTDVSTYSSSAGANRFVAKVEVFA